jgi:hypothetical protein
MTASESIWRSPRVAAAVIIVLLFLAWRLERIVAARRMQDFKGRATRVLTEVLSHANNMGGPITIEGTRPELLDEPQSG